MKVGIFSGDNGVGNWVGGVGIFRKALIEVTENGI